MKKDANEIGCSIDYRRHIGGIITAVRQLSRLVATDCTEAKETGSRGPPVQARLPGGTILTENPDKLWDACVRAVTTKDPRMMRRLCCFYRLRNLRQPKDKAVMQGTSESFEVRYAAAVSWPGSVTLVARLAQRILSFLCFDQNFQTK